MKTIIRDFFIWITLFAFEASGRALTSTCSANDRKYRRPDGSCNNLEFPTVGQSQRPFIRLLPKKESLFNCGENVSLPNARETSRILIRRGEEGNELDLSLMIMAWGQLIDHDIELTPPREIAKNKFAECCQAEFANSPDCCSIISPRNDPFYGRNGRPRCMSFLRSKLAPPAPHRDFGQGGDVVNNNTPWVDGSFIYGSNDEESSKLRTFSNGQLKTMTNNRGRVYPPISVKNSGSNRQEMKMMFGDSRGDVHPAATMLTTIFVRNHNRLARQLEERNSHWDDEQLYQEARKINSAIIQHITFTQFIDGLLGEKNNAGVTKYIGEHHDFYNPNLEGAISMGFATAAYRLHTFVSGFFQLRDKDYNLKSNQLQLRDIFHNPLITMTDENFDDLSRGLCMQPLHKFDNVFSSEMTEWLFRKGQDDWGLDIGALNVQRGRDHLLPGYPAYRELCGLGKAETWKDLIDLIPGDLAHRLFHVYDRPDDVDLYIAGNMERPVEGSAIGPTFHCLIREQFERLRNADRFFYTNPGQFTEEQLRTIGQQTLARVICDNADDPSTMFLPRDMFHLANRNTNPAFACSNHQAHPGLNIDAWKS